MSAYPQPYTKTSATNTPRLDRYGRDPFSPSEKLRISDYEKGTGYCPLYSSLGADLGRLTSGNACTLLIIHCVFRSTGRPTKGKEKRPEWTIPTAVKDWAQLCFCDERTIEREIKGLADRKMAEVKREKRGLVSIRLLLRDWQKLPDYHPNVVDISTGEELEPEEDQKKNPEPTRVELTVKPQPARAGKCSRKIPVTCGVKNLRLENKSPIDLTFSAVVQAGELVLTSQVPEAWLKKAAKQIAVLNGNNNIASAHRHARRQEQPANRGTPGNGVRRNKGEHPRAKELCNLFDPILLKSQSRILSADPVALSEACQAAGSTDHNFLIHFLFGNHNARGNRPIKRPTDVAAILRECSANWKKVKDLPPEEQTWDPQPRDDYPLL